MNEDNKKLGSDGKLGTGGVLNVGNALLKNEEEQKTARALAELLTSKEASLYRYETNGEIPLNAKAREDERRKS